MKWKPDPPESKPCLWSSADHPVPRWWFGWKIFPRTPCPPRARTCGRTAAPSWRDAALWAGTGHSRAPCHGEWWTPAESGVKIPKKEIPKKEISKKYLKEIPKIPIKEIAT